MSERRTGSHLARAAAVAVVIVLLGGVAVVVLHRPRNQLRRGDVPNITAFPGSERGAPAGQGEMHGRPLRGYRPPVAATEDRTVTTAVRFTDVTASSGITFVHTDGSSGRHYIMEAMSAGLAVFDYDNDGDEDLYLLNGAPLPGTVVEVPPRNALYRNNGDGTFTDVTEQAGVGDPGFGLGVTAGDYDGDGFLDLYLNNFGPNVLYRNNGNGTFTDVTETSGTANGTKVGAGCAFFDMDADGDLDLYVANYVKFDPATHRAPIVQGVVFYPGPLEHDPEPDTLYRNHGDGTFTDVSEEAGIAAHAGTGMGMICFDADGDGRTDVFVANDGMANFLFLNRGDGRFDEVGGMFGVAYDLAGLPQASMAPDVGDYDNDGWLDLIVTSYENESAMLYRNFEGRYFLDMSRRCGLDRATLPHVTWGAPWADFDNDGDLDLFIACGHTEDNIQQRYPDGRYREPNLVLINLGDGRFADVSAECGPEPPVVEASRGAGVADLDNDGDLDVVVLNSRRAPTILRNDSPPGNHWLQLSLRGEPPNRFAVGAKVAVTCGGRTQFQEVHSGRGYQSHWGFRLHFGLGGNTSADRIEVTWPSGKKERFQNAAADRHWTLQEGTGRILPR
ncbi:CRTAC1 family protein [Thermopirellula anaerolimosa]